MIKVFVADDHAVVRRGVIQILGEVPDIDPVGEAGTGSEVLQVVPEIACDLLILDISMPGTRGLDLLKQIKALKPDLHVLILSVHPEEQYAVRALRAGAAGYLTKESAPDELIAAIRKISQGGRYITLSLAEKLAAELGGGLDIEPHQTLSDREYQVMRLLANGKSVTDIATDLSLSVKTVSTYRTRILQKLDLTNTAEIIRYALERGLVE